MSTADAYKALGIGPLHFNQLISQGQLKGARNSTGKGGVTLTSVQALIDSGLYPQPRGGNPFTVRGLKRAGKKIARATIEGLFGG